MLVKGVENHVRTLFSNLEQLIGVPAHDAAR